jgi:hypothetical protein
MSSSVRKPNHGRPGDVSDRGQGWTKSLSGIGHIAKMAEILYWAQLWFGRGATTDHEHEHGGFREPGPGTALLSSFSFRFDHPSLSQRTGAVAGSVIPFRFVKP